jgi:hypothetical protein
MTIKWAQDEAMRWTPLKRNSRALRPLSDFLLPMRKYVNLKMPAVSNDDLILWMRFGSG